MVATTVAKHKETASSSHLIAGKLNFLRASATSSGLRPVEIEEENIGQMNTRAIGVSTI